MSDKPKSETYRVLQRPNLDWALKIVGADQGGEYLIDERLASMIDRYLIIVTDATPALKKAEWCALCDVGNGALFTAPGAGQTLYFELADAADEMSEKWGIDAAELAERVEAMPLAERYAIAEIVQRFWAHTHLTTDAALDVTGAKIAEEEG